MKLRKLLLAGAALATMSAVPAQASIVDNPHFKVLGLVIVWGADATGGAPVVSDFVIDTAAGAGDVDLIADDVHTVVTGSLTPTPDALTDSVFTVDGSSVDLNSDGVMDASDAYGAFTLTGTSDVGLADAAHTSSFYVASNTAFQINATASVATGTTPVNFTLGQIGYDLEVVTSDPAQTDFAFGANSQYPHTTAGAGVQTVADLGAMSNTPVFIGNRRTAGSVGTIATQSVRFDATYTLGGTAGYDLSMGNGEIETDVVYTVFVP